jgi:hypothetical protein
MIGVFLDLFDATDAAFFGLQTTPNDAETGTGILSAFFCVILRANKSSGSSFIILTFISIMAQRADFVQVMMTTF